MTIAQGAAEGYGQFQTHVVNSMEIVGRTYQDNEMVRM